jgi:hypothetical protein
MGSSSTTLADDKIPPRSGALRTFSKKICAESGPASCRLPSHSYSVPEATVGIDLPSYTERDHARPFAEHWVARVRALIPSGRHRQHSAFERTLQAC